MCSTVYLEKSSKAHLPEIDAYEQFLKRLGFEVLFHDGYIPDWNYKFVIKFPATKLRGCVVSHKVIVDFNSLSIGRLKFLKDFYKQLINLKYTNFFFLNEYVREKLPLLRRKNYSFRGMGVPKNFAELDDKDKVMTHIFDVVYVGTLNGREGLLETLVLLRAKGYRVAAIGIASVHIEAILMSCGINYYPPASQKEVRRLLLKSHTALNFIPDREPFNKQESTKLLEYAAVGIPVISNSYWWVDRYSAESGFSYIDLAALLKEKRMDLSLFSGKFLKVRSWDEVLENNKIFKSFCDL